MTYTGDVTLPTSPQPPSMKPTTPQSPVLQPNESKWGLIWTFNHAKLLSQTRSAAQTIKNVAKIEWRSARQSDSRNLLSPAVWERVTTDFDVAGCVRESDDGFRRRRRQISTETTTRSRRRRRWISTETMMDLDEDDDGEAGWRRRRRTLNLISFPFSTTSGLLRGT